MPVVALALLLSAAVGHATWNYFAKGARNDLAFSFAFVASSTVLYAPITLAVLAFGSPTIDRVGLLFVAVSSCFHITYYFMLSRGYRQGDLSLVYPLARGTGPVLAVAGAIAIYGERPSLLALAGTLLVVGGILVMSWPLDADASKGVGISLMFALATGACTAIYTLWDKRGVDHLSPVLYGYGLDIGRTAMFAPFALSTVAARSAVADAWRTQRRAILGIAILSPAAYIMVLAALRVAPVSYVAPAREISILFGAMIGWRVLGERDAGRRIAGAAGIVGGVFALAMG
ncbi:MAG TPA: DMT family transporter [Dehalococcoidia bacterium]|jgi:drug/metabolite transporter (DMT)-like permease